MLLGQNCNILIHWVACIYILVYEMGYFQFKNVLENASANIGTYDVTAEIQVIYDKLYR